MTRPATGSAHHQPSAALRTRPTQHGRGQVGAQQGLLGVGDGAGRAELAAGPALGQRQHRHHDQAQRGEPDPDRGRFGLASAPSRARTASTVT